MANSQHPPSSSHRLPTTQSPTSTPIHLVPSLLPRISTAHTDANDGVTAPLSGISNSSSTSSNATTTMFSTDPMASDPAAITDPQTSGMTRLGSDSSLASASSAAPKTASFFASSPLMTPPPASRPSFVTHQQPPSLHLDLTASNNASSDSPQSATTPPRPSSFLSLTQSTSREAADQQHYHYRHGSLHRRDNSSSSSSGPFSPGLKSASSVRSRRNWDEFEGKPITPLPSPNVNQIMENNDSMYTQADAQPQQSTSPPTDSSSSATSSKTKNFFTTSYTPTPPARRPIKQSSTSSNSSNGSYIGHARSTSNQSSSSSSAAPSIPLSSIHAATTTSPTFPSWPIISSAGSSRNASPSAKNVTLPEYYQRPSRFPTLPSSASPSGPASSDHLQSAAATAPMPGFSQNSPHSPKPEASSSPPEPPSSLHQTHLDEAIANATSLGLGPPPAFDSKGKPATSRHVHGPSENATGSSVRPLFREELREEREDFGQTSPEHRRSNVVEDSSSSTPRSMAVSANNRAQGTPTPSSGIPTPAQPPRLAFAPGSAASSVYDVSASSAPLASPRRTIVDIEQDSLAPMESEDEAEGRVGNYHIEKTLGVGAFSRVVLASLLPRRGPPTRPASPAARDASTMSSASSTPTPQKRRSLPWARPWRRSSVQPTSGEAGNSASVDSGSGLSDPSRSPVRGLRARLMTTSSLSNNNTTLSTPPATLSTSPQEQLADPFGESAVPKGTLVALKMLAREPCANNERMKVSWVREVEVLKHISHPCLIKVFHSFSTPKHHVLVLERIAGGELFDYLASHHSVIAKREWLARRLCSELANAIGWMHSVNLVHRDIKLENIILTRSLPSEDDQIGMSAFRPSTLGPIPLVKITDFGLSRFIDPAKPLLETRCGSEEYASPELIIGKKYDGRKTDVWSMGVVFYAILTGMLPFGDQTEYQEEQQDPSAANGDASHSLPTSSREGGDSSYQDPRVRKARLLRIAKGDLRYPPKTNEDSLDDPTCPGKFRLVTPLAKQFLSRLLRRDATKRANAWDAWDEPWLINGSFAAGEQTACGEVVELVPDPRTENGRAWLASRAGVRGGEVSTLAKAD